MRVAILGVDSDKIPTRVGQALTNDCIDCTAYKRLQSDDVDCTAYKQSSNQTLSTKSQTSPDLDWFSALTLLPSFHYGLREYARREPGST